MMGGAGGWRKEKRGERKEKRGEGRRKGVYTLQRNTFLQGYTHAQTKHCASHIVALETTPTKVQKVKLKGDAQRQKKRSVYHHCSYCGATNVPPLQRLPCTLSSLLLMLLLPTPMCLLRAFLSLQWQSLCLCLHTRISLTSMAIVAYQKC